MALVFAVIIFSLLAPPVLGGPIRLTVGQQGFGFNVWRALRRFGMALPADITCNIGCNLQSAINSAVGGDNVILQPKTAGSYTVPGVAADQSSFTLPVHTGASYVTIKPSTLASLPAARVSASDANNMARIVAISGRGAFQVAINASWWRLEGLEITNSSGGTGPEHVVDLVATSDSGWSRTSKPTNFQIDRCFIHPQEEGLSTGDANYNFRTASHGVTVNAANLSITRSRISGFFGAYAHDHNIVADGQAVQYSTGPGPFLLDDNYLDAWFAGLLTGGADTDSDNFGTVAASPAPTTSVFKPTVSGGVAPVAGKSISVANAGKEFSACKIASVASGEVTCLAPLTWNGQQNEPSQAFTADSSTDTITSSTHLRRDGALVRVSNAGGALPSPLATATTYFVRDFTANTFKLSATLGGAAIDLSTNGTGTQTVTSNDWQNPAPVPVSGATTKWAGFYQDGFTITHNTFNIDPTFAQFWRTNNGANPKGYIEFKNGINILFEGNIMQGWPTSIGFGLQNQSGSAPWSALRNITLQNNLFLRYSYAFGPASVSGYSRLTEDGENFVIRNNLAYGNGSVADVNGNASAFFTMSGVRVNGPLTVTHNTVVVDNEPTGFTVQMGVGGLTQCGLIGTGTYKDNIFYGKQHGHQGLCGDSHANTAYTTLISDKNLIVNNGSISPPSDINTFWWANSIIVADTAAVKFVGTCGLAAGASYTNCALASDSPGKNAGSDGTDVGVNFTELTAVLAGGTGETPASFTLCKWNTSPPCATPIP